MESVFQWIAVPTDAQETINAYKRLNEDTADTAAALEETNAALARGDLAEGFGDIWQVGLTGIILMGVGYLLYKHQSK
jgi:hypothetical protein